MRFALRSLRRRRTFAAVAIATLALSIGAAAAIFSVVDAVLFRPLPVRDTGRLVTVWQTDRSWKKQSIVASMWDRLPLDYTDFASWRAKQTAFTGIAMWAPRTVMLDRDTGPEQVTGARVSPAFGAKTFPGFASTILVSRFVSELRDIASGTFQPARKWSADANMRSARAPELHADALAPSSSRP